MTTTEQFEQLVTTFERDVTIARNLESPNLEDDLTIKAAIVGFSYNAPTATWQWAHHQYVTTRLEQGFRDEDLVWYGKHINAARLFLALCLGYLLGLRQHGELTDDAFMIAEAQIPGILMLHLDRLCSSTLSEQ